MANSSVVEAGLFTVGQASFPEDQLEQFLTYRVGRALNMITPLVIFSIGFPGNLMTLVVLTRSAFRTSSCGKYLMALAVCDMLIVLLYFCFGFVDVFLYKLLTNDLACKLYYFLFFTSVHLSPWLLVAVTTQRCFVVCRPMTSRIVMSKRCTVCVIGGLTVGSVTLNAYQIVIRELVWSENAKSFVCHVQGARNEFFVLKVWPWIDATAYCFLPSSALFILNILLVRALRKAAIFRKSFQSHRQKRPTNSRGPNQPCNITNSDEDFAGQVSSQSLFVCGAGHSESGLSQSVVAPQRGTSPLSQAWSTGGSEPVPEGDSHNSFHKATERNKKMNDKNDQTTKSTNRHFILRFFSSKKKYEVKENGSNLSPLASETYKVTDPSSKEPVAHSRRTQGVREREPAGSQKQERESDSRQLTRMPLLASCVFLLLSAPLAIMLVAENTVWIRDTARQVAVYTLVRMVANTLMYLNHSVNFLLYCFAGSTFRRHCCSLLWAVCPCLCPCPCPCCPCCPSQFSSRPVPKSSNSSNF